MIGPAVGNFGSGLQPALAGHADIEKQYIRLQRKGLACRTDSICRDALNLQCRPLLRQHLLQGLGQQWLVFGNQGAWGTGHGAVFKGNVMEAFVPPALSAIKLKVAASP